MPSHSWTFYLKTKEYIRMRWLRLRKCWKRDDEEEPERKLKVR